MNYKEWNDAIREVANEAPRMVSALKLPNTVMVQYKKDESKELSSKTFLKVFEGLGLSVDILIKDNDGNIVDKEAFRELVTKKFAKADTKKTLAAIAGISLPAAEKPAEKPVDDMGVIVPNGDETPKPAEKPAETTNENTDGDEPSVDKTAEVAVDLDSIFG